MRLKEALAIAKALNMEIKLLAYGEQTKTLSEDDYEAMRRYSAMPAEWRKIANSTINNLYESWRKVTSLVKRS